jgi:hypothetical protein
MARKKRMGEAAWFASSDPEEMLKFVGTQEGASERKLRLFGVACCRRIWHLLPDECCRRLVEVSERYADGDATREELEAALAATEDVYLTVRAALHEGEVTAAAFGRVLTVAAPQDAAFAHGPQFFRTSRQGFVLEAGGLNAARAARVAETTADVQVATAFVAAGDADNASAEATRSAEHAAQCDLLRDLFGPLPFRAKPAVPAAVLAWNDGCIPKLAAGICQDRDFSSKRMGVLADALEEAGATDEDVLGHLRGPGPHCWGCWVLDLILKKE